MVQYDHFAELGSENVAEQFDELEYYKELYEKEMEFSNRLNEKIGTSITMLSIIGSGHVLLVSEIFPMVCPFNIWNWISIFLLGASLIAFGFTLVCFRDAYSGYTYGHFPIEEMAPTIACGRQRNMDDNATQTIRNRLSNQYRDGAIHNRKENIRKSKNHYRLNKMIMISFVVLAILFVLWFSVFKSNVYQTSQPQEYQMPTESPLISKAPEPEEIPLLSSPTLAPAATQYVDVSDDP